MGAQERLSGPRLSLLELPDDLPEEVAGRPAGVRALPVIERDPLQPGVEEHLPLGDPCERGYPRDQPGLADPVRGHPHESVQVPVDEVHEDRLGEVVQVETEHERVGAHVPRCVVEELTPPNAAERAGNGAREFRGGTVDRGADRLLGRDDPVLHSQGVGQGPGRLQGRRTIAVDPLVHAQRDHADGRPTAEVPVGEGERDAAVLAARKRHRDGPAPEPGELAVHLASDPLLDGLPEVRGAEMDAPVRLVDDRRSVARGAAHGRTPRSASI